MAQQADPWPIEVIGGKAFSTLNIVRSDSDDSDYRSLGWRTVLIIAIVCVAIGAASKFVIERILVGDFFWGKVFGIGLFVGMYGSMLVGAAVQNRKNKKEVVLPARPEHVPDAALRVLARVRNSAAGSRCVGWLWFDSGLVYFWSEAFWFRLKREDIDAKDPAKALVQMNAAPALKLGRPFPEVKLSLIPVADLLGTKDERKNARTYFHSILTALENSSTRLDAVYPPIRSAVRPADPMRIAVGCILAGLAIGGCIHLATAQVSQFDMGAIRINPMDGYLAGLALTCGFGAIIYGMNHSAQAINRKLDELKNQK